MKIQEAITIASVQFIRNFKDDIKSFELLEKYATEELELDKTSAKQFAKNGIAGKPVENLTTDTKKFYLWYYINYVAGKPTLS